MAKFRLLPAACDEGWNPYYYLVYAAFTFAYPIVAHECTSLAATALAAAIFLVLYFRGYWLEGRALLVVICAIAALGALLGLVNPSGSTYFVYAAGFAPFVGSSPAAWRIVAVLVAAILLEAWLLHLSIWFWLPGIVFTAIVGATVVRAAETARLNAELRAARADVERLAKVAERERIARDMHDVLGHTLSVIVLKAELASKLADRDMQRAATEIRDVESIARDALGELREALAGYRAAGIAIEIERARGVLQAAGVRFECEVGDLRLSPRQEGVLALAIREAVTNIVRHAGASTCRLQLTSDGTGYRFTISDDGRGTRGDEGLGLTGMRERVEALGGTLAREVADGTRLILTLPATAR